MVRTAANNVNNNEDDGVAPIGVIKGAKKDTVKNKGKGKTQKPIFRISRMPRKECLECRISGRV